MSKKSVGTLLAVATASLITSGQAFACEEHEKAKGTEAKCEGKECKEKAACGGKEGCGSHKTPEKPKSEEGTSKKK